MSECGEIMKLSDNLRQSVLQAAIQGKLTEQRAEDGNVKDLLYHIRQEKEKLIAEGKLKKEKPLPMITDEEKPFDIPDHWVWIRLGEICKICTGNSIAADEKKLKYSGLSKGLDYIGTKDISFDHKINYDNGVLIPDENDKFKHARKNSILLCIEGGSAGRKISITKREVCFGNKLCNFDSEYFSNFYIYFYLQSPIFKKIFLENLTGIIGGVNIEKMKSILIPLPPLTEQNRIVERVEEIMKKIDELDKAETELEALKKKFPDDMRDALLQAAIQGKLTEQRPEDGNAEDLLKQIRADKKKLIAKDKIKKEKPLPPIDDDEKPFDIPDNWAWVRLGEIFQHNTGKALNSANNIGKPLEYITTSNVYWNRFELNKLKTMLFTENEIEKCTIQKGDLLVLEGGDVGRAAIWNYDFSMRIQNHIHRLRAYKQVNTEFFYYTFLLYKNSSLINGKGIGIQGLSSNVLNSLIIPLPPLTEQERIVERLNKLLPLCEAMKGE